MIAQTGWTAELDVPATVAHRVGPALLDTAEAFANLLPQFETGTLTGDPILLAALLDVVCARVEADIAAHAPVDREATADLIVTWHYFDGQRTALRDGPGA